MAIIPTGHAAFDRAWIRGVARTYKTRSRRAKHEATLGYPEFRVEDWFDWFDGFDHSDCDWITISSTAAHEAGHAVVAAALGCEIRHAWSYTGRARSGRVDPIDLGADPAQLDMFGDTPRRPEAASTRATIGCVLRPEGSSLPRHDAMIAVAGPAAQVMCGYPEDRIFELRPGQSIEDRTVEILGTARTADLSRRDFVRAANAVVRMIQADFPEWLDRPGPELCQIVRRQIDGVWSDVCEILSSYEAGAAVQVVAEALDTVPQMRGAEIYQIVRRFNLDRVAEVARERTLSGMPSRFPTYDPCHPGAPLRPMREAADAA